MGEEVNSGRCIAHGTALSVLLCLASSAASGAGRTDEQNGRVSEFRDAGAQIAMQRCAKPVRVTSKRLANAHDPKVIDEVHTYVCPGVTISIYTANFSKPGTQMVETVNLSGAGKALPHGIQIGSGRAALERVFGPADQASANRLDYHLDIGPGDDVVSFILGEGRVKRIRWAFHIE